MFAGISSLLFVGLGLGFVFFLVRHDRGAKEPEGALWGAFGFGALAIALTIAVQLPLLWLEIPGYNSAREALSPGVLFLVTLFAASIEEVTKFVPLAFFIRKKSHFNEVTDGILYFALSGLAFSVIENLRYVLEGGDSTGFLRTFLLLFFHPATTAITGYYFARAKVRGERLSKTVLALAVVSLMHALYNYGFYMSETVPLTILMSIAITLVLNGGLFLYYVRAEQADESLGLASVGTNRYCRQCGFSNQKEMLYCEHCGQLA